MIDYDEFSPLITRMERSAELLKAYVECAGFRDCHDGTGFDDALSPWMFMRDLHSLSHELLELTNEMKNWLSKIQVFPVLREPPWLIFLRRLYHSCDEIESNLRLAPQVVSRASGLADDELHPDDWAEYSHGYQCDIYFYEQTSNREYSKEYVIWLGHIQKRALDHLSVAVNLVMDIKTWLNLSTSSESIAPRPLMKWADLSPIEQQILEKLANGQKTSGQLALDLEVSTASVLGPLRKERKLRSYGLVESVTGRDGGYKISDSGYRLVQDSRRIQ